MKLPAAILAATIALPALAAAQSIGEPIPGRSVAKTKPAAARPAPVQAMRPCPEYGPGFVRVEGSSACVRVGGGVRVEFGKTSGNRGYGSAADAMVYGEARGQTSLGEVRAVVSGRGRVDNNLNNGWQRW
ncbi:porin [Bosea sp. CS1GBMeth4]|uniref:porin n=1 Tax=Bosea sp. CS1GBMeth4 TaxID=1892849 RepID=UPI0016471FDF|nr:porin [Bosea sp. CS1GBMeth4]